MSDLKTSPLEGAHRALGARLVPFAGWNMPVQYTSILDEHRAVRTHAGVFDISHMGQFLVEGAESEAWLNRMFTNNVAKLDPGKGQYSLMLNEHGGVIDDLIVYRTGPESFFIVVNASKAAEDLAWLERHRPSDIVLRDHSERWAGMAVQGPEAESVFANACHGEILPERNGIMTTAAGAVICRTGYTGEDGFEFFCPNEDAVTWWNTFLGAGGTACGLGARDTLRLEMCYPLNGSDLSPDHTPIEAGLGFFCDLDKGDFIGRETLAKQKEHGPAKRLVAIQYTDRGAPPRAHYRVVSMAGDEIGELTSGALSPSLKTGICMAYLPAALAKPGTEVQIDVRGRLFPATVVRKPFYR